MLCKAHTHLFLRAGGKPCPECGIETYVDYLICDRCSTGFDQCNVCRSQLKTGRSTALIQAFMSDDAAHARKERREAIEHCWKITCASGEQLRKECEPAETELKQTLVPFSEALALANKQFYEPFEMAEKEYRAIEADPNSSAGQKLDASNRLNAARNAYSKASQPAYEVFRESTKEVYALYEAKIAPFRARHTSFVEAAEKERDALCVRADGKQACIEAKSIPLYKRVFAWMRGFTRQG